MTTTSGDWRPLREFRGTAWPVIAWCEGWQEPEKLAWADGAWLKNDDELVEVDEDRTIAMPMPIPPHFAPRLYHIAAS